MKQSSTLNSGLFLYFSVTDSQWQDYTFLARCLHRKHTQFLLNNETVHIQERTGLECTELHTKWEGGGGHEIMVFGTMKCICATVTFPWHNTWLQLRLRHLEMYVRNRIYIHKHGKQPSQTFGLCLHNFFCLHSSLMPNSKQLIKTKSSWCG